MTKVEVKALQRRLNKLGAKLAVDGIYGPLTKAAEKRLLGPVEPLPPPIAYPPWVGQALLYVGLKEVKGKFHNKQIIDWWKLVRLTFQNDEIPWCAGYVGGTLEEVGLRSSGSGMARSYNDNWGIPLTRPAVGSIVTFWRGKPDGYQGHVGYVLGEDRWGNLIVLSGNVDDMVKIKPFGKGRVLGYYWPRDTELKPDFNLPLLHSDGKVSTNEA